MTRAAGTCSRCNSKLRANAYTYNISIHRTGEEAKDIEGIKLCHACAVRLRSFAEMDDVMDKLITYRRVGIPFELACTVLNIDHDIGYRKYARYLDDKSECLSNETIGKVKALHFAGWSLKDIMGELNIPLRKIECAFNPLGEDLLVRIIRRKLWRERPDIEPEDEE